MCGFVGFTYVQKNNFTTEKRDFVSEKSRSRALQPLIVAVQTLRVNGTTKISGLGTEDYLSSTQTNAAINQWHVATLLLHLTA